MRDARAQVWLERHTLRHETANSTAYCLGEPTGGGSTAADGRHVYFGMVAVPYPGGLPLGTKIRTDRPVFGKRRFTVHDHIGYGSQLDFWLPGCGMANQWGRQNIGYRVLK